MDLSFNLHQRMDSTQTLPQQLRYGTPPTMPQGRRYTFSQPALDNAYGPQSVIQIDLPRLQRSYLTKNSYLSFNLDVTFNPRLVGGVPSNVVSLDTPGAFSLIDTIEVYDYRGSTLLERTAGVAQLLATLMDVADPSDKISPENSAALGTRPSNINRSLEEKCYAPDTTTAAFALNSYKEYGSMTGTSFFTTASGTAVTVRKQFSLPLYSFLGLLSSKFAPLHNGYTVMIYLNPLALAFGMVQTPNAYVNDPSDLSTYSLNDVTLECDILELGPQAESMVLTASGSDPLVIHSKAMRNYQFPIKGGADNQSISYNFPININISSMTGLLWIMRDNQVSPKTGSVPYRSIGGRIRNYLSNWSLQYGSSVLPKASGINCRIGSGGSFGSNAYWEFLKFCKKDSSPIAQESWNVENCAGAFGNNDLMYPWAGIAYEGNSVDTVSYLTPRGRFACGLDTTLHQSDKLVSGLNTNGMATSIQAFFNPSAATTEYTSYQVTPVVKVKDALMDAWVQYDAFISVLPGVSTSVAF